MIITGTLHEDLCRCMAMSRSIVLRIRNVLDKSCGENENTDFTFHNVFPKIVPSVRSCGKIWQRRGGATHLTIKQGACVLHAGKLRIQTHTQNKQCLLLFHCNDGCRTRLNVTLHVHCPSS